MTFEYGWILQVVQVSMGRISHQQNKITLNVQFPVCSVQCAVCSVQSAIFFVQRLRDFVRGDVA